MSAGAAAAVRAGRRRAEALMVDTCRIRRVDPANPTVPDPDSLAEVPNYLADDVYTGPCRVQRPGSLKPQDRVAGGFEFGVNAVLAQLPLSATGVVAGDRFELTAVSDDTDPDLLGLVATVRANLTKTHPTKRTLVCEEVSS